MARFGIFGRSKAALVSYWGPDAILGFFYDGAHESGVPFWSTVGTLFGTWAPHDAFFIVFSAYFFKALLFIDFGRPKGSKIDALGRWLTWLKCSK